MKYCCESMDKIIKDEGCIILEDGEWRIEWKEWRSGDTWMVDREISYCPFCGVKLK